MSRQRRLPIAMPSGWFVLLALLMALLCVAGGASRADALGQPVVRAGAVLAMIVVALFAHRSAMSLPRITLAIIAAAALLTLLQLVPMPPAIWSALPGRSIFLAATQGGQPWRPLSIQPDATLNAAMSLTVPLAVLVVLAALPSDERDLLVPTVLTVVCICALIGLAQFAGSSIDNPFVNDLPGEVSGLLANRNHLALLLAIGCLVAPVWSLAGRRAVTWRVPFALGLLILFLLIVLATGSRAGTAVAALAAVTGMAMARGSWRGFARRRSRWLEPAVLAGVAVLVACFVVASILSDRAQSIHRAVERIGAADERTLALPTVLTTTREYFPAGAGFGTFDAAFRLHEPFALLDLTYLNHAHDDLVEILQDGGLAGVVLLVAALIWWGIASARVWRRDSGSPRVIRARLGSVAVLLVLIASIFDYPARTPLIMAVLVIAGAWLEWGLAPSARDLSSPLPPKPASL